MAGKSAQPVVEVSMVGLTPADTHKGFKTRPCRGKGVNPSWNTDNSGEFRMIILPEIAILYIHVFDNVDKKSLGYAALPLNSIRQGYRHVFLEV